MRKASLIILGSIVLVLLIGVVALPDLGVAGSWRDINPDAYISPPANPQLNSVYMLSSTEGWAVGDSRPSVNATTALPAIFHYDGATWNFVPAPKFPDFPSTQSPYNLTSVTFGAPDNPISRNDGWAVGYNTTLSVTSPETCGGGILPPLPHCNSVALHWDGVTWKPQIAGLSGVSAGPLWSAFMVSSSDVWAVGQDIAGTSGTIWHWTGIPGLGGGWNLQPLVGTPLYSVFMSSSTDGWAVGAGGIIFHYTAGVWAPFTSPVATPLRSVFMLSPTEGWAVGDGGVLIQFTTGIWTGPVSPGTTVRNLFSVFMVSAAEGWAAGSMGTILHFSGGSWTALSPNLVPTSPVTSLSFNSLYFNSAADGWSVGTDGVILRFDGTNFGTVTSPSINNFTSVSFGPPLSGSINPNDGWAVGNSSATPSFEPTIYHWNGFMWTKGTAVGTMNNLNSVFMVSTSDAWTVGGGPHPTGTCSANLCPVIMHFSGGSWNTITPPPGSYTLRSVFMVSSSEGWAVGSQARAPGSPPPGIILHYTASGGVGSWAIFPAPSSPQPIPALNSVFMVSQSEGWAVGDNATIIHYTVTGGVGTWNVVGVSGTPTLSQDANLTSVFMLSQTSGWAVGGIQQQGSFSAGPVMVYWDGAKWTQVAVPNVPGGISPWGHTSATLKSVFCSGSNDCWTVGYPGKLVATIMHWDGVAWNHVTTTPALLGEIPPILTSIYMISPTNGWVMGATPDFRSPIYYGGPGFKQPLSTMLQFVSSGGQAATTSISTTIVVSTFTLSTGTVTTSVVSTLTSLGGAPTTTTTVTVGGSQSSSGGSVGGIPGFPVESIIVGVIVGILALAIIRRRGRKMRGVM
ncbi:MAG: hypothetical protein ABSF82_06760 [Candidatus Bathyarchaeia archaeon]